MRSFMTLRGVYNYNNTIFSGLILPFDINDDVFTKRLLLETDDLEILIPDPVALRGAIFVWAMTLQHSWKKIHDALYKEYSPIENYDRNEDWTDNNTRTDNTTSSSSGGTTGSGTVGVTNGSTNTRSNKAYNTNILVANEKDQVDGSTSTTTSDSTTSNNTVTNTGTVGNSGTRKGRVHGNIGVTTNQQMINAEIELRVAYQVETIIIKQFKQQFCLLIY